MAKILIIDDNKVILDYFKRIQSKLKHEVITTDNSMEGCRLAQDPAIRIIITDFRIPGGLQEMDLIRELKRLRPELPVVVMSGFSSPDIIKECQALGVSDFLTKPFELSFTASIVKRLLGQPVEDAK